jgi:hypothetical protein
MKVTYLRPCRAVDAPALADMVPETFPASCYLVEVSAEARVEGPLIEDDVLVVDESRPVQHADLVVVQIESQLRLFKSHRIGGTFWLLPANGGVGHFTKPSAFHGVVMDHVIFNRRWEIIMQKDESTGSDSDEKGDKNNKYDLNASGKELGDIDNLAKYAGGKNSSEDIYKLAQERNNLFKDAMEGSGVDSILRQTEEQDRLFKEALGEGAIGEVLRQAEEQDRLSKLAMGESSAALALREVDEHQRRLRDAMGGDAFRELMQQAESLDQKHKVFDENYNPYVDLLKKYPLKESHKLPSEVPLNLDLGNYRKTEKRENARDQRQQRLEDVNRQQLKISAQQYEDNKVGQKHKNRYNAVMLFLLLVTTLAIFFEPQEIRSFLSVAFSEAELLVVSVIESFR